MATTEAMKKAFEEILAEVAALKELEMQPAVREGLSNIETIARYNFDPRAGSQSGSGRTS
jgi:hypothetical protein